MGTFWQRPITEYTLVSAYDHDLHWLGRWPIKEAAEALNDSAEAIISSLRANWHHSLSNGGLVQVDICYDDQRRRFEMTPEMRAADMREQNRQAFENIEDLVQRFSAERAPADNAMAKLLQEVA